VTLAFETRRASPSDADEIATAHLDSIRSIGARFYPADVVDDWSARLVGAGAGDLYVGAMERGEVFYVAVGVLDGRPAVLGFASHRVEASQHRTAVNVRGAASRCGLCSVLFRLAEADAIAAGATTLTVDASLAAVEFYKANGFAEVARGQHHLRSGRPMPCVFMRKDLGELGSRASDVG
jgi:putative acetyltransferase